MKETMMRKIIDNTGLADNPFYKKFYRSKGVDITGNETLANLPTITWERLQQAPFQERTQTPESNLVKIVRRDNTVALFARTRNDIGKEYYGIVTDRPLVAFNSMYEGLEKSLWVYEQNYLPLIAEETPQVTVLVAARYGIDGIIGDTKTITTLLPLLAESFDLSSIKAVSVVDTVFELERVRLYCPNAEITAVLALPEVGTIATACPESLESEELIFHPVETTIIEHGENALVTRLVRLPTPIVRYESGLSTQDHSRVCRCENGKAFTIKEDRRDE